MKALIREVMAVVMGIALMSFVETAAAESYRA